MVRVSSSAALLFLLSACAVPQAVGSLQDRSPPPEFGRPGWVRTLAGTGAWIGGLTGGVVSIALLPITYPISLLGSEGFGEFSAQEFLFFPAVGGAALGHFLLGAPPDVVDHLFRRAWISGQAPENSYQLVPSEPPKGAGAGTLEKPPDRAPGG
jgi:hypothetical protein